MWSRKHPNLRRVRGPTTVNSLVLPDRKKARRKPPHLDGPLTATELARFDAKYVEDAYTGCWNWVAGGSYGYGAFYLRGRQWRAHRVSYEHYVGPIPDSLVPDHLCRNPSCVNPNHLEPVTYSQNTVRGTLVPWHRGATHCRRGHELTQENTFWSQGKRSCKTCARHTRHLRQAAARATKPPKDMSRFNLTPAQIEREAKITHCPHGHEYTPENIYRRKNGSRFCGACERGRAAANYARGKA